jgi:hypothetical protein
MLSNGIGKDWARIQADGFRGSGRWLIKMRSERMEGAGYTGARTGFGESTGNRHLSRDAIRASAAEWLKGLLSLFSETMDSVVLSLEVVSAR